MLFRLVAELNCIVIFFFVKKWYNKYIRGKKKIMVEIRGKNEYEHMILKFNEKINAFEDITKQVIYLKEDLHCWYIVFDNQKAFHFQLKKIKVGVNPKPIETIGKKVYINHTITVVFQILHYPNLGYKVFLENKKTLFVNTLEVNSSSIYINMIDIHLPRTGNKVFDYYKMLSKYASDITCDDTSVEKLMFHLYKNIDNIDNQSVLFSYTHQSYKTRMFNCNNLIFPFATNLSQIEAIKKAFTNNLSVISGPPGTGKTQVILNIIANAVLQNKKIAVISNNNTAVKNVYLRLKQYGYDFILANLGNKDNVKEFFEKRDCLENSLKCLKNVTNDIQNVNIIVKKLENLYIIQNKLQKKKQEQFALEKEYEHYKKIYGNDGYDYHFKIKNYEKALALKNELLYVKHLNIFNKIKIWLKYRIRILKNWHIDELCVYLEKRYYELKMSQLQKEIVELENILKINQLDEVSRNLIMESNKMFQNYLIYKYENMESTLFTKENYKEKFSNFTNRYPVTLSTTHSLLRNCNSGFMYDLVILDEASQSDILTTLLTMHIAKNMVIIGDSKQLSQIDNDKIYDMSCKLSKELGIEPSYQYKENSILESVLSLKIPVPHTLLKEHYRCDSRIIGYCNKKFYNDELIIYTDTSVDDPLLIVHTVPGNHARKNPNGSGLYNDRETMEIINILSKLDKQEIGIISPFSCQVDYIRNAIQHDYPDVEVDTVHKYQGRQKDIIILSTVVNDLKDGEDLISNFVSQTRLLNVAISRAIKKIYLVVSDQVYHSKNNNISQFIDYIQYHCLESVKKGEVTSIFDFLYKDSYKVLKRSSLNKKYDSPAEEIMMSLLKKILKDYPDYKIAMHVRLKDLVNHLDGFTEEERRYIHHPLTHVDFVIFDKITYSPKLCIEVDGTRYHDYSRKQIHHDVIKTKSLEMNNIKILRLKTNGSNEKEKIVEML